jgi:hypothetical protein
LRILQWITLVFVKTISPCLFGGGYPPKSKKLIWGEEMALIRREVWADSSPQGSAFVMLPDLLAVQIRLKSHNSTEGEIHALFSAVHFLRYSQDVPTVFHTDCRNIADAINGKTRLGKGLPRQAHMLEELKKFFRGGCWIVQWVDRQENRVADRFSKFKQDRVEYAQSVNDRGFFQIYSLNLSESEFRRENGHVITKTQAKKQVITARPPVVVKRDKHMSSSDYLRSCMWPPRKNLDQIFACA